MFNISYTYSPIFSFKFIVCLPLLGLWAGTDLGDGMGWDEGLIPFIVGVWLSHHCILMTVFCSLLCSATFVAGKTRELFLTFVFSALSCRPVHSSLNQQRTARLLGFIHIYKHLYIHKETSSPSCSYSSTAVPILGYLSFVQNLEWFY